MTMTVSPSCFGRVAVAALVVIAVSQRGEAGFIGTVGVKSDGGILVGTSYDPHNDTNNLSVVNDVIGDAIDQSPVGGENGWNDVFSALDDLPLASAMLQNFEGTPPVGQVSGSPFAISDFDWFSLVDPGGGTPEVWTAPDGATATFYQISSSEILGLPIVAFRYNQSDGDDAEIAYYTAKSDATNGGFSVWSYTAGELNVAYVDNNGDIDSLNGSVVFDPRVNTKSPQMPPFDISHINLWSAVTIPVTETTPEPGSMTLFGMGALAALGAFRRRQRQAIAA